MRHKLILFIGIVLLIFPMGCTQLVVIEDNQNTPPTASFEVTPSSGTTETVFSFDASNCSDAETPSDQLVIHWDWETDETLDTDYSTTKTNTHQYSAAGTYTVTLEVKDEDGLTDTHQVSIAVAEGGDGECIDAEGRSYETVQIGT